MEGVDYIFLTVEEFERGIREGMFLEYAKVYGNYYGTPKDQVLKTKRKVMTPSWLLTYRVP